MASLPDPNPDHGLDIGIAKQSSLRTEQGEGPDTFLCQKLNPAGNIDVKTMSLSTNAGTDQEAPKIPGELQDGRLREGPVGRQQPA